MSLQRTALRVATVLALANYYDSPWPTMANGRVFDSRIDPLPATDPKAVIPSISVYTDIDSGTGLSSNNGGPPFRRMVTLTLWLTLGMQGENEEAEDFIMLPQTDARLEGMLDLFEYQVRFCFSNEIGNRWSALMRRFYTRCVSWKSDRTASAQNVRLAARQITATIELKDDDLPLVLQAAPSSSILPDYIQDLLDAVEDTGEPRGDVIGLINLLQDANLPVHIVCPPIERILFAHVHADQGGQEITPKPTALVTGLDL